MDSVVYKLIWFVIHYSYTECDSWNQNHLIYSEIIDAANNDSDSAPPNIQPRASMVDGGLGHFYKCVKTLHWWRKPRTVFCQFSLWSWNRYHNIYVYKSIPQKTDTDLWNPAGGSFVSCSRGPLTAHTHTHTLCPLFVWNDLWPLLLTAGFVCTCWKTTFLHGVKHET